MMNRILFIILSLLIFQKIYCDESTAKIILNNKSIINEGIKSINEKNVVLESDKVYKNEDIQEIYFRNKGENNNSTVLLLNNDALLYFNEFLYIDNKASFNFLNENIELPIGLIKGIIYKNTSNENSKVWKKSLSLENRKSDTIFVLSGEKLLAIEGIIKEIEKEKIKIFWDGKDKTVSLDKVISVLFASAPEKLNINYEVQTVDGSKIYCNSLLMNNEIKCKIGFSDNEEDFYISSAHICRIIFNNRKATYISLLEPIEVVSDKLIVDVNSYWEKDQSIWKKPLSIGNKIYAKGLGVHSYCKLKYKIPEGSIQFCTDFGIDNEVVNNSGCIFKIIIDKKVFMEEVLKSADGAKSVSIDLPNKSQEIILIVEPGPNLDIGDHGVWGNARFIKN